MSINYTRDNEDKNWVLRASHNAQGFGLATAKGNLVWTDKSNTDFQLNGDFQVEHSLSTGQFRVIAHGTEVDNGPTLLVRLYLPNGGVWKKTKSYLTSNNKKGRRGLAFILNFDKTPRTDDIKRIQFVVSASNVFFERALEEAYERSKN